MSNNWDFQRLSNFVGGIVDRKVQTISMSISGSAGYLRSLVLQSKGYSDSALLYSNNAASSATDADTAAASSLIVLNQFTSTYLGKAATDPTVSSLGNPVTTNAFYIRSSDGRLRYVTGFTGGGVPIWADATVTADLSSLATAGASVFVSKTSTTAQTVAGPITFQSALLGPRVSSWSSQQLATAIDVNDRITTVQNNISAETTRATAAETSLSNNKLGKGGSETIAGNLTLSSTSDAASLIIRNTNPSGRQYRVNAWDDGRLRVIDDTAAAERLWINSSGAVGIPGALVVGSTLTTAGLVANRADNVDVAVNYQYNGTTRWVTARSQSSSRFYIGRYNSSGVYIDSPIVIAEADGAISLNKTTILDTLSTRGNISVDTVGGALLLNNTSGVNDTTVQYRHLGYTRWVSGRSAAGAIFYINRFNDTGTYVDTPFKINETNGWVSVNNQQVLGTLSANNVTSVGPMYAQANGTGQAIAIGDDAWIGDVNVANSLSVRGQSNFNAGYIVFGNSTTTLGCNAGDPILRYGGNRVTHDGNFDSYFEYGSNANGKWERRRNGVIEMWNTLTVTPTFASNVFSFTITLPFALTTIENIQLTVSAPARSGWNPLTIQPTSWNTSSINVVLDTAKSDVYMDTSPKTVFWNVKGR